MEWKTIIVKEGPISTITLNRPHRANGMSQEMVREMTLALRQLDADENCRVIVLEGAGKGFCSGGDLGGMKDEEFSVVQSRADSRTLPELMSLMTEIGKVTIAKVHGYAMAGGLGLAVSCDLTVIADNAKLGTSEIKRGLFPFIISATLSRNMPQKKMLEMLFTGMNITPKQAEEWGLCNYSVPADELDATVERLAGTIASYSPAAIRLGKEAVYNQRDMEFHKALMYLAECLTTIKQSRDAQEGIAAFLEKRTPTWVGK